ncbi:MAG: hypothetical protein JKY94_17670 [Rhodobacteraceae bacterium]|nr:hypothetical protein [Paracoccaceae bacterium]
MSREIDDFNLAAEAARHGATLSEAESLALYDGAPEMVDLVKSLQGCIHSVRYLLENEGNGDTALKVIERFDTGEIS